MSVEALGVLLQGVGSILLALVTAVVGWRAAGALRVRIEGVSLDRVPSAEDVGDEADE